jgi:uncharacterized membrane protein
MTTDQPLRSLPRADRIVSIDVIRGLTMLLMYMLPYIFYSLLAVVGIDYLQTHFQDGWTGIARSAVFAVCLVGVTGLLPRCHIRLKV